MYKRQLICILPLINILAISLSSNAAATAGLVKLLPVDFTLKSYEYVAKRAAFWKSLGAVSYTHLDVYKRQIQR